MSVWKVSRHDRTVVLAFEAPPHNLMTFGQMTELERHVAGVGADDSVDVLVIASAVPGWYIAHGDLGDLVKLGTGEPFEGEAESWPRTAALLASIPQVTIAAIDGRAGGGGCEFTLTCDVRVAGPGARFHFPEVGLGMIPGGGGTQRLPRLVGAGRAAEIILSGREVGAEEALRIGLVDALLGGGRAFDEAVLTWAARFAAQPREARIAAKRAVRAAAELPLGDGLAREAELVGPLLARADTLEIERRTLAEHGGVFGPLPG